MSHFKWDWDCDNSKKKFLKKSTYLRTKKFTSNNTNYKFSPRKNLPTFKKNVFNSTILLPATTKEQSGNLELEYFYINSPHSNVLYVFWEVEMLSMETIPTFCVLYLPYTYLHTDSLRLRIKHRDLAEPIYIKEKSKSIAMCSPFKKKICMLGTGSIVIHVSCSYMKYSNSNPWRGVSAEEYIGLGVPGPQIIHLEERQSFCTCTGHRLTVIHR